MSHAQRILIIGGLALALFGMSYGLYFALFDEHQTHQAIGGSLANSFANTANGDLPAAQKALENMADYQFEYAREVHAHSHWISLGMLLIILGMAFRQLAYPERFHFIIAASLLTGACLFPLGVLLQTMFTGLIPKGISIIGTFITMISFFIVVIGFILAIKKPD